MSVHITFEQRSSAFEDGSSDIWPWRREREHLFVRSSYLTYFIDSLVMLQTYCARLVGTLKQPSVSLRQPSAVLIKISSFSLPRRPQLRAPSATTGDGRSAGSSKEAAPARVPPRHSTSINNLSDRQYCCVWSVEVYDDGYRPDVARVLLSTVARHVNPILRSRGWRVKRLIESASTKWIGSRSKRCR